MEPDLVSQYTPDIDRDRLGTIVGAIAPCPPKMLECQLS